MRRVAFDPLAPDAVQPVLATERLVLRAFESGDARDVQRLAGAFEVADGTLSIPHPYPDGGAELWIATHPAAWANRTLANFAVVDRKTDALMGAVGVVLSLAHARGELGYWIGMPYWNHGYCTEAVHRLMDFAFEALELHRLEARHFTRNPASGRVMQKAGMTFEGVHREAFKRWDRFEDVAMYGILRDEWRARRAADAAATKAPR